MPRTPTGAGRGLQRSADGNRQKTLFQFLNEVGARALSRHIGRVQEIAKTSASAMIYEGRINDRFGDQRELDFLTPLEARLPLRKVAQPTVNASLPLFAHADARQRGRELRGRNA
jgi:hypothetical protein